MNKQIKALNMAIEALEDFSTQYARLEPIINACKEALEQPAQEPVIDVARVNEDRTVDWNSNFAPLPVNTRLYTHPYQWRGLTDDEIDLVWFEVVKENNFEGAGKYYARAIEQALKDKNK